jgi:superfamily I DNA/RNA helicase
MLTSEQEEAVTTDAPYSVVMAGAGSGKTTLLTERILHLLERGVEPHRIMPVTFTRKAAKELVTRTGGVQGMPIGTFHALCLNAMSSAGMQRNVIDEEQADDLLDKCAIFNGLAIPTAGGIEYRKQTRSHWKKHVKHHIETGENSPLTDTYLSKLALGGDVDYQSIIHTGLRLARDGGSLFDEVEYVILDEAQDTTKQQWEIVHEIGKHACVMAVGDIAQNLFSWAGADPEHFASLADKWKRFELTETFRCSRNITNLCNSFPMQHVQLRTSKGASTTKVFMSDDVEGVVGWLIEGGMEDRDVAVLCRYNWQVEEYTQRLQRAGFRVSVPQEQPRGPAYRMLMYMANMSSHTARESMRKAWAHLDAHGPALWMLGEASTSTAATLVNNWLSGLPSPTVGSILSAAGYQSDSVYYARHFGGCTLSQFAAEASLLEPIANSATPGITVSTIHSAKGGEWSGVVVPGLDVWPRGEPKEDEWRVFYVAITRSSDVLCLMCPGEPGAFAAHCLTSEDCYV